MGVIRVYALVAPLVVRGLDKGVSLMTKHRVSLNSNDKEGFIRAFTDEWAEIQVEYGVVLEFTVEPTQRKGVLRFCATALDPRNGLTGLREAYYQCEYPSAAVASLEASLFSCMVKLERVLRDKRAHPMGKA
jgi:hypothetical protein